MSTLSEMTRSPCQSSAGTNGTERPPLKALALSAVLFVLLGTWTSTAGHYTYELEIESAGPEARVCVGVWDEKGNEAGFAVVKPSGS